MHDSYNDPDKAEDIPAVTFMENREENMRKFEKMKPFMLAKANANSYFGTVKLRDYLSHYLGDEDDYDELTEFLELMLQVCDVYLAGEDILDNHPHYLQTLESLKSLQEFLIAFS